MASTRSVHLHYNLDHNDTAVKNLPLIFSKSVMPQLSMYPKDLVYPSGGGEIQLEMIRAEWPVYKRKFIFTEPEDNGVCDMDMTEACFGNITLNIPVLSSVEKGMRVNVMQETGQGSCRVPLKG